MTCAASGWAAAAAAAVAAAVADGEVAVARPTADRRGLPTSSARAEVPEALRARMVQEDALQAAAVASRSDASRMRGWAAYPVLATDLRVAAALLA